MYAFKRILDEVLQRLGCGVKKQDPNCMKARETKIKLAIALDHLACSDYSQHELIWFNFVPQNIYLIVRTFHLAIVDEYSE